MSDETSIAAKLDQDFIDLLIKELNGQSRRAAGTDRSGSQFGRTSAQIGAQTDWIDTVVAERVPEIGDDATPADAQPVVEDETVLAETDAPPAPQERRRSGPGKAEKVLLEIIEPKHGERVFRLHRKPVVIGRGNDADIVVRDTKVSRQHLRIELDAGRVMIRDLNSQNGTKVNGRPVQEMEIISGDEIEIGQTTIRVKHVKK